MTSTPIGLPIQVLLTVSESLCAYPRLTRIQTLANTFKEGIDFDPPPTAVRDGSETTIHAVASRCTLSPSIIYKQG